MSLNVVARPQRGQPWLTTWLDKRASFSELAAPSPRQSCALSPSRQLVAKVGAFIVKQVGLSHSEPRYGLTSEITETMLLQTML